MAGGQLVAPVFEDGARWRTIYFPWGQWRRFEGDAPPVQGPGFAEVEAPLERIPLYVRQGAAIPRYAQAPQHLKGPVPQDWILDISPGTSQRRLTIPEAGFQVVIDYTSDASGSHLQVSPAPIRLKVRLAGVQDSRPIAGVDASDGVDFRF